MTKPLPIESLPAFPVVSPEPPVVSEKPKLTLVPPPQTAPEAGELLALYRLQTRNCWLCAKIAGDLDKGKKLSDDDTWHFTSCVLSWEKMLRKGE